VILKKIKRNRRTGINAAQIKGERLFYTLNDLFLLFFLLIVAYPIIYVFSASFSSPSAVISGKVVLFPVDFSLEGYKAVFENGDIVLGYANTIFYTVAGTIINIFLTIICAYPLSRKEMYGRDIFMFIISFTMIFSGGLIPTYILVQNLGLINTRWAMLLPNAIGAYNVIIARTYFQTTITDDLFEVAQLNGCSHIRFLWSIVLPLSKAVTAVLVLFYAVGHWNQYFNAFIYLSDRKLFPLQIILREILVMNQIDSSMVTDPVLMARKQGLADLLKYSLIIVASVPVWIAYPFVQKHFVKGVMIGAVKG